MFRYYSLCLYFLLFGLLIAGCSEKLDPEEKAAKERNEIIKSAPINIDYKINPPEEDVPENIKAFSGRWVGKWNDAFPSQLVVTNISRNQATFIYSWASIPQRGIEAGKVEKTVNLSSDGKIEFEIDSVITSFVFNPVLKKIIGAKINGDEVSNIVMEKVK